MARKRLLRRGNRPDRLRECFREFFRKFFREFFREFLRKCLRREVRGIFEMHILFLFGHTTSDYKTKHQL